MRPLILALALAAMAAGPARAAQSAWVEMTAAGPEARVVTDAPACPAISIGGRGSPDGVEGEAPEAFANNPRLRRAPAGRAGTCWWWAAVFSADGQGAAQPAGHASAIPAAG